MVGMRRSSNVAIVSGLLWAIELVQRWQVDSQEMAARKCYGSKRARSKDSTGIRIRHGKRSPCGSGVDKYEPKRSGAPPAIGCFECFEWVDDG